jgi:hypothetical protein
MLLVNYLTIRSLPLGAKRRYCGLFEHCSNPPKARPQQTILRDTGIDFALLRAVYSSNLSIK